MVIMVHYGFTLSYSFSLLHSVDLLFSLSPLSPLSLHLLFHKQCTFYTLCSLYSLLSALYILYFSILSLYSMFSILDSPCSCSSQDPGRAQPTLAKSTHIRSTGKSLIFPLLNHLTPISGGSTASRWVRRNQKCPRCTIPITNSSLAKKGARANTFPVS